MGPPYSARSFPARRVVARGLSILAVSVLVLAALAGALGGAARGTVSTVIAATTLVASASPSRPSTTVVATPGPEWINVTDSGAGASPPAAYEASSAYDPVDHVTVLFGGCQVILCPSNETWLFGSGHWVNVTNPHDAPPARYGASMDYDPNMQGILLFGGLGASGVLSDTWLFAGARWTNLSWVGAAPPGRTAAMMAFDPDVEENGSVLFGGALSGGIVTNDTWVWQGWSGWTQLNSSVYPPPVEWGSLTYDAQDHYLLLFGGTEPCGFLCFLISNATWQFYAGEWWPVHPAGAIPGGRFGASMTYDPALGEAVLFGGVNGTFALLNDTWTYAAGSWQPRTLVVSPPARAWAAGPPDSGPMAPMVVGGLGLVANLNDTWVFEPPIQAGVSVSPTSLETSAPVTVSLTIAGGTPPYRAFVDFGDGSLGLVSGTGPVLSATHVYTSAGTYAITANLTDDTGADATVATPSFDVVAGPVLSAAAQPESVDVGMPVHLGVQMITAGIPPVTFVWHFGDGATSSGANVSHVFSAPGSYTVAVNATDAAGGTAGATVVVRVAPLPTLTAAAAPTAGAVGSPVQLFANVTGGTAPFSYAWQFGDGNDSGSPTPIHTFARSGTFAVNVWVNDSGGGSMHATVTVDVASVTSAGGEPGWFLPALVALVALGAAGVAAVVILTRRRPASPKP